MRPPARATRWVTSLSAHVDHVRLPGRVEVGKMRRLRPDCAFAPRRRRRRPGGRRRTCGIGYSGRRRRPPVNSARPFGILAGWHLASPRRRRLPARSRRMRRDACRATLAARPRRHARGRAGAPARSTRRPRRPLAPRAPAASTLPDLGDSSQVALSPAQERKLGETIMRQLRAAGALPERPRGQRLPERARPPAGGGVARRRAGLRVLRRPRPADQRVRAAGRLHRRQHRPDPAHADRVRARERARARDHARHAAPHGAHAGRTRRTRC